MQASACHCGRLSYYIEWSTDKMQKDIGAVHKEALSVQQEAEVF